MSGPSAPAADFVVNKGGPKRSFPFRGDETLEVMPLGGGNEVGRSCCLLKFKGKTIMFDCGVHPGYRGEESLPFFDEVDADQVDLLLVTHFHVDHAAGVPYWLTKTAFKGKTYMTYPTLAICKLVWSDFIKVSGVADGSGNLYNDKDIQDTISQINLIDYHQEIEVEGVRFSCFNAGHVLGACMFLVQIAGVRVLYTGDYSRQEDRHLMAAEMPGVKVNVLVVESTYGVQTHEPRRVREKRFLESVITTLQNGGRALLPVFAIGRAQELLLLLEEHWKRNPDLHRFPIICLSGMAKRCIASYRTFIYQMNQRIQHLNDIENPFDFKHIRYMTSLNEFDDNRPAIVMASPGMLQNGPSRELFDRWCEDKHNSVVITGYCVQNTLAKDLLDTAPSTHTLDDGREVALRIRVHYVSFSAHADFIQTSQFIDELQPSQIVLVHGEANMMASLKKQLVSKYESGGEVKGIWSPQNTESVSLTFHESKVAKVIGSVAVERPQAGAGLQGVVLHKNFQLTIVSVDEIAQHAGLQVAQVVQRQQVPFNQPWEVLLFHLRRLFDDVKLISETTTRPGDDDTKATPASAKKSSQKSGGGVEEAARVLDAVDVRRASEGLVSVEWESNPVNDLVADSIVCVLMQTLSSPAVAANMVKAEAGDEAATVVEAMLKQRFGQVDKDADEGGAPTGRLRMVVDGSQVVVDVGKGIVECVESDTQKRVEGALKRILACLYPVGAPCPCE